MGMTFVDVEVRSQKGAQQSETHEFLVDSGAFLTCMPGSILRRLGVEPDDKQTFTLANGDRIEREIGEASLTFGERQATTKVIFGEEDDSFLLGSLALEGMGYILDPLKRELRPALMRL